MGLIKKVYAVMKTSSESDSGSPAESLHIVINQNGSDRLNKRLLPGGPDYSGSCAKGDTFLMMQPLPVGGLGYITEHLLGRGDLYVRLLTTTTNLWRPDIVFVFGEGDSGIVPLAYQNGFSHAVSTDLSEGLSSIPVSRVTLGDDSMIVDEFVFVIRTTKKNWAGTSDGIRYTFKTAVGGLPDHSAEGSIGSIDKDSALVLHKKATGPREERHWNNFHLEINGHDACQFDAWVFALSGSGTLGQQMTLAALGNDVVLSGDPTEGERRIALQRA